MGLVSFMKETQRDSLSLPLHEVTEKEGSLEAAGGLSPDTKSVALTSWTSHPGEV